MAEEQKTSENVANGEKTCSCPENICIHTFLENGKNRNYDAKDFWQSRKFATSGLLMIFKNERNFRFQLVIAAAAIGAGFFFGIDRFEWIALFVIIAIVLVMEAINSVVEAVCDTISQKYNVYIHYAKDVSAGAVMLTAILSVVVGVIIFAPYIWELVENLL